MRGGARAGAGRKPLPNGAITRRADGRLYEKRAGVWVRCSREEAARINGLKETSVTNQTGGESA